MRKPFPPAEQNYKSCLHFKMEGEKTNLKLTPFFPDETPPVISSCPTDISLTTDPGLPTGRGNWTTPFATDNSKHVRLISNWDAGDDFQIGTTEVTYTAIDNAGLTASCQFTVTVVGELHFISVHWRD